MSFTHVRCGAPALAALVFFAGAVHAAGGVPANLGYGLEKLVEHDLAARGRIAASSEALAEQAAGYAAQAITDAASGRILVDVTLDGYVDVDTVARALGARAASLSLTAIDRGYRGVGILEGYVALDDVPALAKTAGVRAVFLGLQPQVESIQPQEPESIADTLGIQAVPGATLNKIGTAFDQGVTQHRIDRINRLYDPGAPVDFDGTGMTIAAISDSFARLTASPTAAEDVANGDLPGAGNAINPQPVEVLVERPSGGTDEGRAMVQILHKMAPRARLGFASGSLGEVEFAESIRQLANLPGHEGIAGFAADVIVDDISYGGEPYFGETIIGGAIDEVAAAGVMYFSSAGNNIGINAYESELRWVANGSGDTAATNTALAGTNIDLAGVPPELYAGGFHNFNPQAGQLDVAQLVNYPSSVQSSQGFEIQWDDPYDQREPQLVEPPIYTTSGTISAGVPSVTFDQTSTPPLPTFVQGTLYVIKETATSGDLDGIVSVIDSGGNVLVRQDTGSDEVVLFRPPTTGGYSVKVERFEATAGGFTFTINTGQGVAGVTTDVNLLAFRADTGAYVPAASLTTNNIANNRPVELGVIKSPSGQTQMQFLIARSNTPADAQLPTRVRWIARGNGGSGFGPAEYFAYNTTTTKGHATAKGCNGTAAYSVFRPNAPDYYTSPGPATILFDRESNRLAEPEIRQVPRIAAASQANTSFFSGETSSDPDTNPNFGGTSAAAPHAAAIAALVLQSRGGPRSVAPEDLRTILQQNTFPHDLDPMFAAGTATTSDGGTVTLTIRSDEESNKQTGGNDPDSFELSYAGTGSIASITFNPAGTAATAGNVTGGNNGVIDAGAGQVTYFENDFPGLVFTPATIAFKLGTLVGLAPGDVQAPASVAPFTGFSNLAGAPSNGSTHFWTMTIGFTPGQFGDGKSMRFTVGRGAQHSSATGNGGTIGPGTTTANYRSDLFGGGVFLPGGTVVQDGMAFSGTTTSGGAFSGVVRNEIGHGWSRLDGFGFIDAEKAVLSGDVIFRDGFDGGAKR
jgi:hypothetical protein